MTLHNGSAHPYYVNPLNFTALAPDAVVYGNTSVVYDPYAPVDDAKLDTTLKPGATVPSDMAFVMPRALPLAAVRWSPGEIGNDVPDTQIVLPPGQ